MHPKKGFAAILLIFISAFLLFTLSFLSFKSDFTRLNKNLEFLSAQKIDPFPGWHSYKNDKLNFTMRYPKDWEIVEYKDFAADFQLPVKDPKEATVTPSKIQFLETSENEDFKEFDKIHSLKEGEKLQEHLDVTSTITKNKNVEYGNIQAIDFKKERIFSAPQGPRREFSHIFQVKKENSVLVFTISSQTKKHQEEINDPIFNLIISSLIFN